jgi:hypothetical protein
MSATVRAATEDDIFDLLVLAREFSREATTMHKWDKDKTEAMLLNSIRSEGTCVFILVDDEGIVQGGLVGTLTEPFMSYRKVAIEMAWFVSKEFRGNRASLGLVTKFEEWGKQMGASNILMADIQGIANLGKLYTRMGYEVVETTYSKEI